MSEKDFRFQDNDVFIGMLMLYLLSGPALVIVVAVGVGAYLYSLGLWDDLLLVFFKSVTLCVIVSISGYLAIMFNNSRREKKAKEQEEKQEKVPEPEVKPAGVPLLGSGQETVNSNEVEQKPDPNEDDTDLSAYKDFFSNLDI